jgi:chemotaxis protein CheX
MRSDELGRILEAATVDVFATMLRTQLDVGPLFENQSPFLEAEVTSFVGLAGAFSGYVALHASREQCRDFTARLLDAPLDTIETDHEIRDAVGEIANMIAGNVKRELLTLGSVEIALPAVSFTPKADLQVKGGRGVVLPLGDYTGLFHVEVVWER